MRRHRESYGTEDGNIVQLTQSTTCSISGAEPAIAASVPWARTRGMLVPHVPYDQSTGSCQRTPRCCQQAPDTQNPHIGQVRVTGIQTFSRLSCISIFIFFHIRLRCKQGTWQRLPTCGVHWYTLSGICIQLRAEYIRNKHPEIGGCRESAISNFFDPSFLHATIHRCEKFGSSRQPVPNASQPWTHTLLTRSHGSLTSKT